MKIAVIGTGYVGLVSGTCFAEMGNTVTCVDIDAQKIENLENGIVPIFEPGLAPMVQKNVEKKNLLFSTSLKDSILNASIVFIAVGTPMGEDGSADLQYVTAVAKEIGQSMTHKLLVVDKSTVPVGTADKVKEAIQQELDKRKVSLEFDVVSNPEFLKEGDAISDFMKPDRVVIGAETDEAMDIMKQLYSPFFRTHDRFITMDVKSAEMTKYAANAMLATKISFMNEIANICEKVGADANKVRIGIGSDNRIGYSFIYPGVGYGGSCFPKDVQALKKIAEDYDYDAKLIEAVEEVNNRQKYSISNKIIKRFGENLEGKTFALWGLAFKPGTDDMREAPAIYTIKELTKRGAKVKAYDPKAMEEAETYYLKDVQGVEYFESKYEVLKNSEALILLTEWKEFRSPDFNEIESLLNNPIIFDGRNQYNAFNLTQRGFEYYQIGKNKYLDMKKVIVLGGGGFIGGHLGKRLKEEGCHVRIADIKNHEFWNHDEICHEFIKCDLTDPKAVELVISEECDEVYQLAADMGGAGYIFTGNNDANVMHNSALINLNVAKECVVKKVKKVFYSSSACMYPEHNQLDPDNPNCIESSAYPANPDSEYGWEKLFSERLFLAFNRNYNLNVRVARFHNIFGPQGTWTGGKEKAPAAMIRKAAETPEGGEIEVWGDGLQTRSFLHVSECVEAVLRLMKSDFIEPVNIGSEEMVTINQLAQMAIDISGKKISIHNIGGQEFIDKYGFECPTGVRGRNSENSLYREKIGWEVSQPLVEGMEDTFSWINKQVNG